MSELKTFEEWWQSRGDNWHWTEDKHSAEQAWDARVPEGYALVPIKLLKESEWMLSELKGWLADQGSYGITGYEETLPSIEEMLKAAQGDE